MKARSTKQTATPAAKTTSSSADKDNPVPTTSTVMSRQKKTRQEIEDENAELRRQLQQLKASRKVTESLIFKPKGQAGRGNGFNLYDEMRLSSTDTYNMIRNAVRVIGSVYLDLRLTWTQQDSKAKATARTEIRKLIPIMKYYHQAWPIKAFLKQYLGSSAAKYRRDIKKIRALDEVPSRQKTVTSNSTDENPDDIVIFSSEESGHEESDGESEMDDRMKITSKKKAVDKKQAVDKEKSKGKTVEPAKITEADKSLPTGMDNNDMDAEDDGDEEAVVTKTKVARVLLPSEQEKAKKQAVDMEKSKGKTVTFVEPAKITQADKSLPTEMDNNDMDAEDDGDDEAVVMKTKVAKVLLPSEQEKAKKQAVDTQKSKGRTRLKPTTKLVKTAGAKGSLPTEMDNNMNIDGDDDVPTTGMKQLPRATRSSQRKDKLTVNTNEAGQALTVDTRKRKSENELEPRPAKQKRKDKDSTTETDWPSDCPDECCEDAFPSSPSKRVAAAYRAYLVHQTPFNAFLVCIQIQNDQKLPDLRQVALKNKWPINIDFEGVAHRIGKRSDEISGLLTNEIVISASAAWKSFIRTLASQFIPLSKFNGLNDQKKFSAVGPVTHCGYYGPRGIEIISATIYSTILGKDQMTIIANLQVALIDVVENHRDTTIAFVPFWDSIDGCLISLTNFIEYVVTPHVANLLIQEDLQLTEEKANTHRLRSKGIGDAFQYTDGNDENALPPRLRKYAPHQLLPENSVPVVFAESSNTVPCPTLKIPPRPRLRTRSKGKGSAPKQLAMSDFCPPAVKKA